MVLDPNLKNGINDVVNSNRNANNLTAAEDKINVQAQEQKQRADPDNVFDLINNYEPTVIDYYRWAAALGPPKRSITESFVLYRSGMLH